jgi:hypothetical protein
MIAFSTLDEYLSVTLYDDDLISAAIPMTNLLKYGFLALFPFLLLSYPLYVPNTFRVSKLIFGRGSFRFRHSLDSSLSLLAPESKKKCL